MLRTKRLEGEVLQSAQKHLFFSAIPYPKVTKQILEISFFFSFLFLLRKSNADFFKSG
jgi:hypothetical protein